MVLPQSLADAGRAQAWASAPLDSIKRLFARSEQGVIILMHPAAPTRLGEVVRFFSDAPPWELEGVVMRVCLGAADLDDVREGSHMLLRVRAEEIPYLNFIRPYFAERRPRAVFWVDEETFRPLRSSAPDLFSFVFRVVEVPPRRWPEFAEKGVRAALDAGVPFAWDGERGELEALLGEIGWTGGTVELRTSMSFREMLRVLERPGLPVVVGAERDGDPWRVRMALARAGRSGAWVALQPKKVPPGMWRLHARQADLDESTATLRAAGWEQAGAMAAWVDLEPERIEDALAKPGQAPAEPGQWLAARIAVGDAPAFVLRARIEDADVAAVREELRRGPAPRGEAARAVWSEKAEPWRDDAEGPIEARLVRCLRCLGDEIPTADSVDAASTAGLTDVAVELLRIRVEQGVDNRAERAVSWFSRYGEVEVALHFAEAWHARAQTLDDRGSIVAALSSLGDLHAALGHTERAVWHYEEGVVLRRALLEREPENLELQHGLSVAYERLGDMQWKQGSGEQARRLYEEGVAIRRSLLVRDLERSSLHRSNLAVLCDKLGDLQAAYGNGERARQHYEEGLALRLSSLAQDPVASSSKRDLAISHDKLGGLHESSGDTEQARRHYEEGLAIRWSLLEGEPGRTDFHRDLSVSYERLGILLVAQGSWEQARQYYEKGLAITRAMLEREPGRIDLRRDTSVWLDRLGSVNVAQGEAEQARRCYEEGLAIARMLLEREPGRADFRRDLAVWLYKVGNAYMSRGSVVQARQHYEEGLATVRMLLDQEPERADLRRDLAVWLAKMSDIHLALGSPERARRYLEEALATYETLLAQEPERADIRHDLAVSFQRMTRIDPENAVTWVTRAIDLHRARLVVDPENVRTRGELAVALVLLANAVMRQPDSNRAAELRREALALLRDLHARGALEARHALLLQQLAEAKG